MTLQSTVKYISSSILNFILVFQIIFASSLSSYAKSSNIDHLRVEEYFEELDKFKKDLRGYELCSPESNEYNFVPFEKVVEEKEIHGVYSLDYLRELNLKQSESNTNEMNDRGYGPYADAYSIDPNFTPIQTKSDYTKFLSRINQNTCSSQISSNYQIPSKEKKPSCVKIKGFLSDVSLEISYLEPDEEISDESFQRLSKKINNFYRKGLSHKIRLKQLLRYNLDNDLKRYLIIHYNQNVALSLRDMFFMIGMLSDDYANKIDELLPEIPSELFNWSSIENKDNSSENFEERIHLNLLLQGTSSAKDPMALEVAHVGDEYTTLVFDNHSMSNRDITTVMEHFSSKNFLYGLRILTVQMMIDQIKNYDLMMNNFSNSVSVPKSCTENKRNGIWSPEVKIKIDQQTQENMREKLLRNHKLLFIEGDVDQAKYYVDNASMDLLTDVGFNSGSIEFDKYQNARAAVYNNQLDKKSVLRPIHDDVEILEQYLSLKKDEASSVYYSKTTKNRINKESKILEFQDINLFHDIIDTPSIADSYTIYDLKKKRNVKVDFAQNRVSNYMKYKMIADGVSDPNDLVSKNLMKKLKQNLIKVSLPSLYSPAKYRLWGLRTLLKGVERVKDIKDKDFFVTACRAYGNSICKISEKPYERIRKYLLTLNLDARFLPLDNLRDKDILENISFLNLVWNRIRDHHKKLPEAVFTEDNYLLESFNAGNDFARMRLSYLIAKEELETLKNSKKDIYKSTSRGARLTSESMCRRKTFSGVLSRLNESMSILGLNNPLRPGYVSSIISKKDSLKLFQGIVDETNSKFTNILNVDIKNENTTYDLIKNFSNKRFNSIQFVNETINKYLDTDYEAEDTEEKLNELFSGDESKLIQFYHSLASLKTVKERQSHYEKYANNYGINSEEYLIEDMLYVDSEIKKPLYKEVMFRAAKKQKTKTEDLLSKFCKLKLGDTEKIKKYFYSTLTVQNKINESLGIAKLPERLMDVVNSMTFEEKRNIGLGLGAFVVAIGATVVLAGSCPFTLGISCGILGGVMAGGAFSMGGSVFLSEYQMKRRADKDEQFVSSMHDIGMTELAASEKVARSWLGTALSTLDVVPILGVVSRGAYLAGRISKESVLSMIKNSSKLGFRKALVVPKDTVKLINSEADIKLAKLITGFTTYTSRFLNLFKGTTIDSILDNLHRLDLDDAFVRKISSQLEKTKELKNKGLISNQVLRKRLDIIKTKIQNESISKNGGLYKYLSSESVNLTKFEIDNQTAHTLVKYFNGNPKELMNFIDSYMIKLRGIRTKGAKAKLSYIKASRGVHELGANYIRKMWNENTYNLAKNHLKLKKLNTALSKVKNEKDFQRILAQHMDEFTTVFAKAPIRLIDLPYMISQGGLHVANTFIGKVPGLKKVGMGLIMRKIANSRSLLVGESILSRAKSVLGFEKVMTAQSVSLTMKGLQAVSLELAEKSSISEAKLIRKDLQGMRHLIVSEIEQGIYLNSDVKKLVRDNGINIMNSNGKVNLTELRRLLFDFDTITEETTSDLLWGTIDIHKLLSKNTDNDILKGFFKSDQELLKDEFNFIVTKAMDNLINDTTVSGLQRYAIMTKIILMSKNLGHIELY